MGCGGKNGTGMGFSPFNIIPQICHTHSFIYHQCCVISAVEASLNNTITEVKVHQMNLNSKMHNHETYIRAGRHPEFFTGGWQLNPKLHIIYVWL
jgi:hypothetical protein